MISNLDTTRDVNKALRLNGAKMNSRYFGFSWKRRCSDDTTRNSDPKDLSSEYLSNTKISNGFLKNVKKRLRIKNLSLCNFKQRIIGIDSRSDGVNAQALLPQEENVSRFIDEINLIDSKERVAANKSDVSSPNDIDRFSLNDDADVCQDDVALLQNRHEEERARSENNENSMKMLSGHDRDENNDTGNDDASNKSIYCGGNIAEPQTTSARESIETTEVCAEVQILSENRAKVNLSEELLKLSKYGWYWGPISGDEADSKLVSEPDGAFLVRDSSDDRYLLTLSFKSSGRLLHARMEHSGGLFSLCNQGDNEGFTSVAALIDHSINSSQSAVFCYSRPKYPGYPSFPVRLTKPVSRFTQVRSLQYLCRFVIRQNTRLDNIHKLPLPKTIRGYIEEAHY